MSNVRSFGAVGNGTIDDTTAIRHAIEGGDGVLFFPPGEYTISETIEIPLAMAGPAGIKGAQGASRILMKGAGPAFRLIGTHGGTGDPDSASMSVNFIERMPIISDIEIVGEHAEADGIECILTKQATFQRVLIRQVRHGIHLIKRNRNVLISDCHIYHNTGVGIFMDGVNLHQINICGSHISYNRLGGIRIQESEVRNLQITGNDIEYNNHKQHGTEPEPTAEIYIDTTAKGASVCEVTIASNTIQATVSEGGSNIKIVDNRHGTNHESMPEVGRPPGLWTITGNVIGNQQVSVHLVGCYGIIISGNTIYSSEQQNMLLEECSQIISTGNLFRRHTPALGTGVKIANSHTINISGCTFHDEHPDGQQSGLPLLEVTDSSLVNISGCQLTNGAPEGMSLLNVSNVNISGCTVTDLRNEPKMKHAIAFRGKGSGNLLTGNIVTNAVENNLLVEDGVEVLR